LDFLPVLLANLVAFLSAFGISFWGNYHWTFRRPGQKARALRRFFTISSGAFALNMLLLTGLLQIDLLLPEWSALLAATVIPAITFLASRFWGFRSAAESEQEI
jgi:putative flippase GtrA